MGLSFLSPILISSILATVIEPLFISSLLTFSLNINSKSLISPKFPSSSFMEIFISSPHTL